MAQNPADRTVDAAGPHGRIGVTSSRDRLTAELFDLLWETYRKRVSYVQTYESVIQQAGAQFVNDHIAFRTFACQRPMTGIGSVSRLFEALGYRPANCYQFEDKHLSAIHYQHPQSDFPKLFISELRTWELSEPVRKIIERSVADHRDAISADLLASLKETHLQKQKEHNQLLQTLASQFHELPWTPPEKDDVTAVNAESQYAAWVLVHGYNVNHFTSLINSHGTAALDDIEKTIAALKSAGVPMKAEIEGARGSKLRQSATEAVVIDVPVRIAGRPGTMPWTYAYFELAERGLVTDPETGQTVRFEGFLGPQATQLFDMTQVKGS